MDTVSKFSLQLQTDNTTTVLPDTTCILANGFLGASGFAGAIPAAYTQLAKLFFETLQKGRQSKRITKFEYQRPSWTFHAKGLWYYQPYQSLPLLTMIGSPNFGKCQYFDT
ncbi:hypothetical protein OTU49_013155 [Cherax quadricarinatus]|uniref:CDP-diacylglycerol--glycerol-3-phosphate 3-phosphatidyltransferase n=1 Tax=Cherax quadricarinatus TaxID=27406 RepID=A0AAW0VUC6_CHEQU